MRNEKRMERLLGYSLVAPAMLLILAIAIWPVIQSFYYSLFDYRLNDPTKSSIHWSYSLDLEGYLQNYPFLKSALKQEMAAADGQTKQTLAQIEQKLAKLDEAIRSNDQVAKQYDKVNEVLDNFETPSDELKIAELDKQTAERLTDTVHDVVRALKEMKKAGELQQADKVVGLAEGLEGVVIEPNFVGLKHYKDSFSDMRLWKALWNTTFFTVVSVAIELVLGLGIALLINKAFFGRGVVRATILIPWAIPTAVSALMWKFLYDGQNGIVAKYFETVGLVDRMGDLLTTEAGAMFAVIFADVWKTTPYMALLLLAGLQTIPSSLYEAASIDGATKWQQFTQITLPLLKSSILVALLFRTLDAFRVFDLIYVLTGGGPANSTETISILAYKVMFSQTNFGAGSALAVVVFLCVAIISMIYIKWLGKDLLSDSASVKR
ncbi:MULTISPECIES: carbohydrate ABC transporter permease [Geobacillus]|uniref:Sugar ABC transporter permease n=1 Tax=Geobacillus thermoleovorans TaxID=33941 RepID=A0A2Z3NCU7_GEOTH|nr:MULTISPECIES: sugar ABC transporter permease [Geobacillus]AWO75723.1 sugar ABC transporter permease [Geobacillus thermoleovorans]EQB96541.1 ABC transporter permease [Geobacillus sp. A8]MBW7642687.1 sugar ABC transporter permease [Geobacillus thermoleovorans]ODA15753.1 ABC transporter permease [Geobacillus thermoleovorans]OQP12362.1 ABC transporter permease [Geobacillus thermoleovorans]